MIRGLARVLEGRAQHALALLRQRLTVNARVLRDGRWQLLPAAGLVPEDTVRLRAGDIIPADVRLTDGGILADQSVLTGESLPVERNSGETVYSGSLVRRGEATGVVTLTGARTYFGKTAELVVRAKAPPRTERVILRIAEYLGILVLVLALGALVAMIARGTPLSEMLPFGLLLLMSSVPVALPTMFTMTAALGARALADDGILVTRLSAIEDAASMNVLCLDKTGTLTENRLTLETIEPFAGDFATMSVSTDKVVPSTEPDRWAVASLAAGGVGLATLLLALNVAVFWSAGHVLGLTLGETQTLVFVWLAVGAGQAVLYLTRGAGFFWSKPYPGRWIAVASLLDVAVVAVMATRGWLMAPIPAALVGGLLALAFVFLLVGDFLKTAVMRVAAART